jgi:hypothetical protein
MIQQLHVLFWIRDDSTAIRPNARLFNSYSSECAMIQQLLFRLRDDSTAILLNARWFNSYSSECAMIQQLFFWMRDDSTYILTTVPWFNKFSSEFVITLNPSHFKCKSALPPNILTLVLRLSPLLLSNRWICAFKGGSEFATGHPKYVQIVPILRPQVDERRDVQGSPVRLCGSCTWYAEYRRTNNTKPWWTSYVSVLLKARDIKGRRESGTGVISGTVSVTGERENFLPWRLPGSARLPFFD